MQFLVTSATLNILLGDLIDLNYHIITCEKTTPTLSHDQHKLETRIFHQTMCHMHISWAYEETRAPTILYVKIQTDL